MELPVHKALIIQLITHIVLLVLSVVGQLDHAVAALAQHPVQLVLVQLYVVPQLLAARPLRLLQWLPLYSEINQWSEDL